MRKIEFIIHDKLIKKIRETGKKKSLTWNKISWIILETLAMEKKIRKSGGRSK